ncbi:MAG: alpha/beta fold hydrolase [Bacteroidota bacterium]
MIEQNWSAFDGTNLYAVIWKPVAAPKAVMAFVHGHGTHCRRYDEWFGDFLAAGLAVISFDLRGHGRSGGNQGTIHRYSEYLEDTALLVRKARENFPNIPLVLYGSSDRVSAPEASENLAKGMHGNVTYRVWSDAPHQLHVWDRNDRVTAYTIDWINKLL